MHVCVCVFRADHLGLDDLSGDSSLDHMDSPFINSHLLTASLYLRLGLCEIALIYLGM